MPSQSDAHDDDEEEVTREQPDDDDEEAGASRWSAVAARELPAATSQVNVVIESSAYASELYVVNRAYALVAKGVGRLAIELEPGRYKIRQRIGYSEHVQDLDVSAGRETCNVKLPRLEFPSPIPLRGTSLVSVPPGPRPFSYGSGTFRFVLRTPVIEDSLSSGAQVERMHAEMRRLRLESFDGKLSVPFNEASVSGDPSGALIFSSEQPPGMYVVVQEREGDRQVCMPILVREGRTTVVFSLALSDEGEPVPVELGHAAMAMIRDEDLTGKYEESLLRMEAARKAIAAGRHVYGWSDAVPLGQPENVLLDLMDVYLGWQCLNPRIADHGEPLPEGERPLLHVDRAALLARLKRACAVLGRKSADVVALAHALSFDRSEIEVLPLDAPPLLKRSWDRLLSFEEGNAQAGSVMVFPYQVESSSTWFLWSEEPGARARAIAEAAEADAPSRGGGISLPGLAGGGDVLGDLGVTHALTLPVKELLSYGFKVMRDAVVERIPRLGRKGPPVVTFENVEAMLAALLEDKSFQDWLNKAQFFFEAEGKTIRDESMRRLISGLRSLSDPTLLEALGADAVAKQALAALRLPQSRVVQLVKDLLNVVVNRMDRADKVAILAVLRGVVGVAEAWLKASPAPLKKP